MSKLWKSMAIAVSLVLMGSVAACGPADSKAADPDVARSYDVSQVKKDDAIAAMLPEDVVKSGELTVGVNVSYAPAEFFAADGKTPVGYEVDFAKALAKVFGLKAKIMHAPFDAIIPAIGSKYNVGISGFTVNAERMKSVDFVTYANAGLSFEIRKGNPTHVDTSNLCGKKVSLQTGTVGEPLMEEAKKQCAAKKDKPLEILSFEEQTDATAALVSGRADVMYADTPVAHCGQLLHSPDAATGHQRGAQGPARPVSGDTRIQGSPAQDLPAGGADSAFLGGGHRAGLHTGEQEPLGHLCGAWGHGRCTNARVPGYHLGPGGLGAGIGQ